MEKKKKKKKNKFPDCVITNLQSLKCEFLLAQLACCQTRILGSYSVYIKIKYNSCYYGFLINNDYGADIINFKSIISFLKVTQYEYCVC